MASKQRMVCSKYNFTRSVEAFASVYEQLNMAAKIDAPTIGDEL